MQKYTLVDRNFIVSIKLKISKITAIFVYFILSIFYLYSLLII